MSDVELQEDQASDVKYAIEFVEQVAAERVAAIGATEKIATAEKWIEATGLSSFDSPLGVVFEVSRDGLRLRVEHDFKRASGHWHYSEHDKQSTYFAIDDFRGVLDLFAEVVGDCDYCDLDD
jgi:hypothetical protein